MATEIFINTQFVNFARISDATGNRDYNGYTPESYEPDHGSEPLCDDMGRLIVRLADGGGFIPGLVSQRQVVNSYSQPSGRIPAAGQIVAFPRLKSLVCLNFATLPYYIQIFDDTGLPAPGAVPLISYPIPATEDTPSLIKFEDYYFPTVFSNGASFVIAVSTAHATFSSASPILACSFVAEVGAL